jgi:hypothetical protein
MGAALLVVTAQAHAVSADCRHLAEVFASEPSAMSHSDLALLRHCVAQAQQARKNGRSLTHATAKRTRPISIPVEAYGLLK